MKKVFTFIFLACFAAFANAQVTWSEGQEVTAELEWMDYDCSSAGAWMHSNNWGVDWGSIEMFDQPAGAEVYQIFYLPAGYYEFTVQGFYRGSYNPAYWDGNEKINAVFFGESVNYDEETGEVTEVTRSTSSPLLSIASSEYTGGRIFEHAEWPADVEYSHDGTAYYVPNSMEGTSHWFELGYYTDNKIKVVQAEDGFFKIGIRKTAALQYDWTIFRNFQAFYISDASEAVQIQLAEEDFVDALAKADEFRRTLEEAGYYSLLGYYELAYEELENESADYKSVEDYTDGIKKAEKLVADYKSYLADATTLTSLIASCNELAETTSYAGLSQFKAAIEKAEKVEKDEFGDDANGIYTDGPEDYAKALAELQKERSAYIATKGIDESGKMDMSGLIAYPFFCQPQYDPTWDEEQGKWVSQSIVLDGDGTLQGWRDLRESGDGDDKTYVTTTRVPIGKGVTIGLDETVQGQWYQVNTGGYEPYWNHGLSSAKQWSLPGSQREIAQNLSGLPNGFYSIQGCGITWGNDWNNDNPCRMGIRIQSGENIVESDQDTKFSGWWNNDYNDWTYYTTGMIQITNGEARVSFFANGFSSFTGMQLYYYGENPDFSKLVEAKLAEVDLEKLQLKGDKNAVAEILSAVQLPIVGYDAYTQALDVITQANTYINDAVNYLSNNDPTQKFTDKQAGYADDSKEYEYLTTAVLHTFDLYDADETTYKDIQNCMNEYNEYVHYMDLVNGYSAIDNADLKAAIEEQAQKLASNYADIPTLQQYEKELAAFYNKQILADLGMDKATGDNPVDATVLIVNPTFAEGQKGWTGNFTTDQGLQNSEVFNTNFRIEQTVYSLPAGWYQVQVKSFYRDGGINDAFDHIWYMETGEFTPNVKFFANTNEVDVTSICNVDAVFTERSYTEYTYLAENKAAELGEEMQELKAWCEEDIELDEEGNEKYVVTSWFQEFDADGNINENTRDDAWIYDSFFNMDGERYFYPNSMRGAGARFAKDNDAYLNKILVKVEEGGSINFGLYKDTTIDGDWCMFDDFKLFYLGTDDSVGINSVAGNSQVTKNIFTMDGRRVNTLQKGINIVKMSDGSVKKVLVK